MYQDNIQAHANFIIISLAFSLMIYRKSRKRGRKGRSIMHLHLITNAYKVLLIKHKLDLKWKWARHKDANKVFPFVVYGYNEFNVVAKLW